MDLAQTATFFNYAYATIFALFALAIVCCHVSDFIEYLNDRKWRSRNEEKEHNARN